MFIAGQTWCTKEEIMKDVKGHITVGDIWSHGDHHRVIVMCLCGWEFDTGWKKVKAVTFAFEVEDQAQRHQIDIAERPYDDPADGRK